MVRYRKSSMAFAVCLSTLAGYVDARGFLSIGYFFSFMSGNSTRVGIALSQGNMLQLATVCGLVCSFVAGVVLGTLAGHFARSHRSAVVLALVSALLGTSATLHQLGCHVIGYGAAVMAMGAENVVFQEGGEVSIGLTYVTGTLVKMGQRLAGALLGGSPSAWLPYACLWLGMVSGATVGAALGVRFQTGGLWFAALYAAVLALVVLRKGHLTETEKWN